MKNPAKSAIHAVLKRFGSSAMRRRIWDEEFASGEWDRLEQPSTDLVYRYIAKYAKEGSILDLGCGTGEIGMKLPIDEYLHYTGVDVSSVALEGATTADDREDARKQRNEFVVADIEKYVPQRDYDAILFMEVLCYFPFGRIKGVLSKYAGHLTAEGAMIAQLWNSEKYSSIIDLIANNFRVIERVEPEDSKTILLVFR